MSLNDEVLKSLLNTTTNVVNKVADDHARTIEKEKAVALEQEKTKRAMLEEDEKRRLAAEEIQRKRQANPIKSTFCEDCTADMTIDRKKGLLVCPYCGRTEPLDAIHHYNPILDGDPNEGYLIGKEDAPQEKPKRSEVKIPEFKRPEVKLNTSRPTEAPRSTSASSRLRTAAPAETASAKNNEPSEPILNKVASAAKLIDTKPVEGYVKNQARGYILPVISLICGIISMVSCGVFIVPEIVGLITGIIPFFSAKSKTVKFGRTISAVGMLMSLSSVAILLLSVFILKK